jgi:hypothetical protein
LYFFEEKENFLKENLHGDAFSDLETGQKRSAFE